MNIRYIREGSITFKFGMEGVYFIRNKIIYDSMTIVIQFLTKNEFQLNTFQNIITNMSDVEWFSKNNGSEIIKENFLNDQYSLFVFRINLAEQFSKELKSSRGKKCSLRFSMFCSRQNAFVMFNMCHKNKFAMIGIYYLKLKR